MLKIDARRESAAHAQTPASPIESSAAESQIFSFPRRDDGARMFTWTQPASRPLDMNGPTGRPFAPMGDHFSNISAFEHLAAVAKKFPDKLAVSDGALELSYAQFIHAATALARQIAAITPVGRAVGLFLGNSAWYPVAMFACMAAGRPSVQLNPREPAQRIVGIVEDAHLSAVICVGAIDLSAWPSMPSLHWLDAASALTTNVDREAPLPTVSVDAPAVILYTSGSTGRPKGIVNSQRAILQRVQQYVDACHTNSDDVFLPLSGPSTIAGCREITTALLTGASLHIVDVEAVGLRRVRRLMRELGVTIVYMVPALLRALLTSEEPDKLEALRIVRIGGEKILWADVRLVRATVLPSCFIQISYSSTETTGSQWFLPEGFPENGPTVPAGIVLPGVQHAIVDDDGMPARIGEIGELWIRSKYVTLGQWENGRVLHTEQDRTDPAYRIFPTGDLALMDAHGMLHVVGRKGRQIKINGRRVEPAELELAFRGAPGVGDVVAVVTDANELIAFVAPTGETSKAFVADLREAARRTLPTVLHPTRLHSIPQIPRLPGGKVDIAKLRLLDRELRDADASSGRQDSFEVSAHEEIVSRVWMKILNVNVMAGRWDEAGGDSLKLLQCVMEIETLINRELNLAEFTVDMTAEKMLAAVGSQQVAARSIDRDAHSPPLMFLLPGSVGYGPSLAAFGAEMASVARVISIRYPDLHAILQGQGTVSAMADSAFKLINETQPQGDVRLLGYSLGGGVAFEVAARLIASGRSVKFLGILDTSVDGTSGHYRETISRTLQRIRSHRVTIHRMICRAVAKLIAKHDGEMRFDRLLGQNWPSFLSGTRFMLKLELEEVLRMRAFRRWCRQPRSSLPINGTLFRCHRKEATVDLGWRKLFSSLDVVPIAGGHLDLVIAPHLARNRPLIEGALNASYS